MKLLTQWAFTSSALILIVLAVRVLFRDRLSARLRYALWGVVLLRLLIPFQVELPAPVSDSLPVLATNMVQDVSPWLEDQMLYAVPTERYLVDRVQPGEEPEYSRTLHSEADREYYSGGVVYDKNGITRYFFMMPASELLTMLWGTGMGLCLLVILYSNWGFSLRLGRRRGRLEVPDAPIPVYTVEGLPSPCLFGVFKPAVYVTPQAAEDPNTLRHVLAHELTHYAHKDHLWSLLRCLALALHWYNPLVWLAVALSKQDGELACDEGAVARLGEGERIPYGRTLVDMVAARSLRPGDLLSCSTAMTGGESSIKRRVAQLVKKPETVKAALFAAVALVALGLVFTFAGRAQGEKGDYATFLNDVENAKSIRLSQPLYSSYFDPTGITDPELLAQAKEILRKDAADWLNPPRVLEDVNLMDMRTLILTGQDGQEVQYQLIRRSTDQQSDFYVITDGSISNIRGSRVSVVLKQDTIYQLDELTRQQGRGGSSLITSSSSPELEEFFAQLESAQSIYVGQPMISSANPPGLISDPEALAQAKDLLGKARGPLQLAEDVTREEFWKNIRPFLSSTEYQDMEELPTITQEDLKDMLFMRGNPILLCPGPEVTPDADYRYWLADHMLLLFDAELEENPKALATFSDDVYSQLAELARTNGALRGYLTRAQVEQINEAFRDEVKLPDGGWGPSEISCFFTSSYDDPTQIDLEEFLMYCPLAEILENDEVEEFQAVIAKDGSWNDWEYGLDSPGNLPVPTKRYPREKVSALLQKYAGVTVEELDWSGCLYLEEYDAFYNFTSDFGPGFFPCAGGQIMEDTVLLWSDPDESGDRCELTLRKDGENWLIQSHHTIYER